jgi:hypothetical protein
VPNPLSRRIRAREFAEGTTAQLDYTARCRQSGNWENTPVANSGLGEGGVTVDCP